MSLSMPTYSAYMPFSLGSIPESLVQKIKSDKVIVKTMYFILSVGVLSHFQHTLNNFVSHDFFTNF